ncbi:alpha/beta fold hydrolase [Streptomyces sp. NPDC006925]|uniref:alpha/beta fold hydrolase n=1 Tax=Streptomyces sp. NPDC006925 TaxID=3364768 RepID=UPI0036CD6A13
MSEDTREDTAIRRFRIEIPKSETDALAARLAATRFADPAPGPDHGVTTDRVRHLVEYWRHGYDWRAQEERLNRHPQFTTRIDGQRVHFLHIRSEHADALPLLLTHGWPGSVVEFENIVAPLTAGGFHLVIPSIPGFGFSGPTTEEGWDNRRIARAWDTLMRRLGYGRYGAAGNDAGSMISVEVGRAAPERVVGTHVTQVFSFPSGDPDELTGLTDEERQALENLNWFMEHKSAFNQVHAQQPQTLAHALLDSPAGLLGWLDQLLGEELDDDFVLANAAIHWFTGTAGSALRLYYENAKAPRPEGRTTVPLALSGSVGDFYGIRRFAERDHGDIRSWTVHPEPTHYLHHVAPEALAEDLAAFFGKL